MAKIFVLDPNDLVSRKHKPTPMEKLSKELNKASNKPYESIAGKLLHPSKTGGNGKKS